MKKFLLLFTFLSLASGIFSQVSKTVNLVTAGTLSSSLTSNELATITNLTLTGTIDARDFFTMRTDMPLLAVLDLSGVTIAAYTGTLGTSTDSYDYPADAIPDIAFAQNKSLTTIVFPSSLSSIGNNAFMLCSGLTTVTIPSSLTSIGNFAFVRCSGLTTITIPSSVTSIGESAFAVCSGLTTITIPSSVTLIGQSAFAECSGLTLITVDADNPNYSSLDGVLYNKTQTTLINCPNTKIGNFTIPSSVTSIGQSAFAGCSRLTTITIPSSVTSIGQSAFKKCSGLTTVTIPPSVTSIGDFTFVGCSGLTTVTIPPSVTSIGESAFVGCSGLTTVTIPPSVTSIGESAFMGCSGLTTVTIPSSVTSIGQSAFTECSGLTSITTSMPTPLDLSSKYFVFYNVNKTTCTLYVPAGSKSAYQAADQWKDFKNIVEKDLTGLDPIISDQELTIYPNPTSGKVKLVFDQIPQGGTTLTVHDFTGKTILTQFIQNKEESIDLKGNSPGIYFLKTNLKDGKVKRILLK